MAFTHYQQIRDQELPSMEIDNVKAFLKDFSVSEDTEKPITSGLFRLEAGESLEYTYTYHEMKLIVDGSFIIQDESGQKVTAKPGDLFYFPKGSAITFSTPDFGVGFFYGQRGEDEAFRKQVWRKPCFAEPSRLLSRHQGWLCPFRQYRKQFHELES